MYCSVKTVTEGDEYFVETHFHTCIRTQNSHQNPVRHLLLHFEFVIHPRSSTNVRRTWLFLSISAAFVVQQLFLAWLSFRSFQQHIWVNHQLYRSLPQGVPEIVGLDHLCSLQSSPPPEEGNWNGDYAAYTGTTHTHRPGDSNCFLYWLFE